MASFTRPALTAAARSLTSPSKILTSNAKSISSLFPSSPARAITNSSRVLSVLASVESLMPFHSATANTRLRSNIAVDASCWSMLSQGFATPL